MDPLRIVSALAFGQSPEDTLALAGEAMSRIWSNDGQMVWRFTQPVTPLTPEDAGAYFNAMAVYTRRYQDFSGASVQRSQAVRLTVTANRHPEQAAFTGFIFDFSDSIHGESAMEAIIVATCFHVTQLLRERRWMSDEQATGLWLLNNRSWSSPPIASALAGGPHDLASFIILLQHYGMFTVLNAATLEEAIWVRRLFQP